MHVIAHQARITGSSLYKRPLMVFFRLASMVTCMHAGQPDWLAAGGPQLADIGSLKTLALVHAGGWRRHG